MFQLMAKDDYPMVTSCCGVKGKAPDGLQNSHAYTLMDVTEIDGIKLAKIRNPWSKEGYNGKYSDSDPFWTDEMLQKAGHKLANDGIFFMPFEQFVQPGYFKSTAAAVHRKFSDRHLYLVEQKIAQQPIRVTIPN